MLETWIFPLPRDLAGVNRDSKTITKWDPCYKIKPKVLKLHHFTGWLLTRDLD